MKADSQKVAAPMVEAAEEQTAFNVILAAAGEKKINVIREVRAITGLGLNEAKELIEAAPKPVKEGVNKEEAWKIKNRLEEAGATILLSANSARYIVTTDGVRLVEQNGRHGLSKAGSRQAVEVPAELVPMIAWILNRREFSRAELEQAFPAVATADSFLAEVQRMLLAAQIPPGDLALSTVQALHVESDDTVGRLGWDNGSAAIRARAVIAKTTVIDPLLVQLDRFHLEKQRELESIEDNKRTLHAQILSVSGFLNETKRIPCNATTDEKDDWPEPVFSMAGGESLREILRETHSARRAYRVIPRVAILSSYNQSVKNFSIITTVLFIFTLLLYWLAGTTSGPFIIFVLFTFFAGVLTVASILQLKAHRTDIIRRHKSMVDLAQKAESMLDPLRYSLLTEIEAREKLVVASFETRFEQLRSNAKSMFAEEAARVEELWAEAGPIVEPFDEPVWDGWTPAEKPFRQLRAGILKAPDDDLQSQFSTRLPPLPLAWDFAPGRGLAFIGNGDSQKATIAALQSLLLRLIAGVPPGQLRFTFVDPVGLGENVAPLLRLGDSVEELVGGRVWVEPAHIEQRLAELTDHMQTVIQKYLRSDFASIESYNENVGRMVEAYRVLVVVDFGAGFTEASARRLVSIAQNGPRCGVYPIVLVNSEGPIPYGFALEELTRHMHRVVVEADGRTIADEDDLREWTVELDSAPPEAVLENILASVSARARDGMHVTVPYREMLERTGMAGAPWREDVKSSHGLVVPLGPSGARKYQELDLGAGTAHHVLLVGQTGSGKSNLLHVMITTLCLKYSPDELELYLVDFKQGVEFKHYADAALPHARVIAIESEREFGLSVLRGLLNEMNERGNQFRKAGVPNIADWRARTGATLSRILLLVDEFRVFFAVDDAISSEATMIIDRLVSQGRAFGIHVVLASQTLAGGSSMPRSISDQMAVRIVLMSTEADSRLALADDNGEARLLSRPGEAIYNNARGLIEGNHRFQVADMGNDDARDQLLRDELGVRVAQWRVERRALTVFEGHQPAKLSECRPLLEAVGQVNWQPRSGFVDIWIGEPIALRPPAYLRLMRQSGSNILMIHRVEDQTLGLTAASILALAAQLSPEQAAFHIIDAGRPDGALALETRNIFNDDGTVLQHLLRTLPQRSQVAAPKAVLSVLTSLDDLLKDRLADNISSDSSVILVLFGIQRIRDLRDDDFSGFADPDSSPTANTLLQRLLREGPEVGIHTIAVADSYNGAARVIDRRLLSEFGRRVVGPMLESDSIALLDEPAAARVDKPHRLIRFDEDRPGDLELFRPYSIADDGIGWIFEAAERLASRTSGSERAGE